MNRMASPPNFGQRYCQRMTDACGFVKIERWKIYVEEGLPRIMSISRSGTANLEPNTNLTELRALCSRRFDARDVLDLGCLGHEKIISRPPITSIISLLRDNWFSSRFER